jgi:predicted amidohydrolase YtcJ
MDIYEQEEFNALVLRAHEAGMQLFIHAIGDAAIENSLNAIESALKKYPAAHRHIVNHFQIGAPDLFEKAASLGVLAAIQPGFVSSDWRMAEGKVGTERLKYSYAWKSSPIMAYFCLGAPTARGIAQSVSWYLCGCDQKGP